MPADAEEGNLSDDSEEAERLLRSELGAREASPSGTASESGARAAPAPAAGAGAADGVADSGGGEREGACIICQDSFPETTGGLMVFTCKREQCAVSSLYCKGCYKTQKEKWNRGTLVKCPTCREQISIKVVGEWTRRNQPPIFAPRAKSILPTCRRRQSSQVQQGGGGRQISSRRTGLRAKR